FWFSALSATYAASYAFTTIDVPFFHAGNSAVTSLNDHGQLVGAAPDSGLDPHAFLDDKGTFTIINGPNGESLAPRGINNKGQISGFFQDIHGIHGFFFDLDSGVFIPLNAPGANLTEAIGINDKGQIVGDYRDSNKIFHGFVYDTGVFTT